MVGVLDVLRQPVLSPVDFLTAHWHFQVLQHHPELGVLGLVVHAVVVLHVGESLLLEVEVLHHVVLQHLQLVSVSSKLGIFKNSACS